MVAESKQNFSWLLRKKCPVFAVTANDQLVLNIALSECFSSISKKFLWNHFKHTKVCILWKGVQNENRDDGVTSKKFKRLKKIWHTAVPSTAVNFWGTSSTSHSSFYTSEENRNIGQQKTVFDGQGVLVAFE